VQDAPDQDTRALMAISPACRLYGVAPGIEFVEIAEIVDNAHT
jgi:hypothetical protein